MGSEERARRARTMAIVCTALGMGAMMAAPLARSATPGPSPTASPRASATMSTSAPAPISAPPIGEQPARHASSAPPETPGWVDAGKVHALVYPPRIASASPPPVTVMLHGLGGYPESACAPFAGPSTDRGWLVCPRGEVPCGDGASWRVRPEDDGVIEASLDALAREHPGRVDSTSPRVLVGFSLGGTAAVRIVASQKEGQGRYAGLVVVASQVQIDGRLLERVGVKRVVLAAGDMDMTSGPLQATTRALNHVGLSTRFVSLGHYGHGYPADMADIMREPMEWVGAVVD